MVGISFTRKVDPGIANRGGELEAVMRLRHSSATRSAGGSPGGRIAGSNELAVAPA